MAFANRSVLDWPTGVTVYKPEKCYNGYTVVNPFRSEIVFLVDMAGQVVRTWQMHPREIRQSEFVRRLENGNWMSLAFRPPPESEEGLQPQRTVPDAHFPRAVTEFDWDGNIVWEYGSSGDWRLHHDMARLENGNTLMLAERTVEDTRICAEPFADNYFFEVTPEKEVVWEWRTMDHFDEFGYSDQARQLMHDNRGDIFHSNTLTVLPGNALEKSDGRFAKGNILSCQRHTNIIFILDKQSGEIVWTWGERDLVGPHHPIMLNNGNILIYDNGGRGGYPSRTRFDTRLVEIDPVACEIVWQYAHEPHTFKPMSKFFSSSWGSVQRLPNGNTFSLDCHKGRLFEVTPSGEIVWEYISPFAWNRGVRALDSGIYRAYRYAYDDVPQAEPYFMNTDGHMGVAPVAQALPEGMGLPPEDLP